MAFFKHLKTVNTHRRLVRKYCFKCGLYFQGLTHDLSKYSYIEFHNGSKYFKGTASPNNSERLDKGFSEAWMHHKGRNKHHSEYWVDVNPLSHQYEPVQMPRKYVAESLCDRIAATVVYNKENFKKQQVLDYFNHEVKNIPMHELTKSELKMLIEYYINHTDKETFDYVKHVYLRFKE